MRQPFDRRLPGLVPYMAVALLLAALLAAILAVNRGTFTYTVDDAYIHLTFSEQLAHGHFGLIAQERASPSSSILYPLLMMPLADTGLHQWQPLLWNAAAVFAAVALWLYALRHLVLSAGTLQARPGCATLLMLLVTLILNYGGLAFSGMEVSLQIACSLATSIGLIDFLHRGRLRWWLLAGVVLGPLIRYENLSLALPAIVLLALYGRPAWALGCLLFLAAILGGYAAYCNSLGLPPLPGSLLVKTGFDDPSISWLDGIVGQLKGLRDVVVFGRNDLPVLLLVGVLVLAFVFTPRGPQRGRERWMVAFGLWVVLVQFVFGGHGSLGRYDAHAWSSGLVVVAFAGRRLIDWSVALLSPPRLAVVAGALLLCLFPYSAYNQIVTPLASGDIYRQQYQMRRLLVDFVRAPAVVNDVGLTAYRNPAGVLDIVGLGSEEVRRLRRAGAFDAGALDRLAAVRGAQVALVYSNWLGQNRPPTWQLVARLRLTASATSVAGTEVTIYALPGVDRAALRRLLEAFAAGLPRGAVLQLAEPS